MSIPLVRFPLLAIDEILRNMQYSEIFNISVCSQRMHILVRRIKFKQIVKMRYVFKAKVLQVEVDEHNGTRQFIVATSFGRVRDTTNCYFAHNSNSEGMVKRSVIDHCFGVFQRHAPIVQLQLVVDQDLGFVPLLEGVKEMYMLGQGMSVEYASIFYPDLNCLRINGTCKDGDRFSGVDYLFFDRAGNTANAVLQTFTGRYLFLYESRRSTKDILQFCRRWKRNEICQNVRFLYIDLIDSSPDFDPERFLAQFETSEWDPNVRPGGVFDGLPAMIDVDKFPDVNTDRFRDFQRNDGKWASLCMLDCQFFLIAWD
ncbi:hypothetical protein CAEBREN_03414 [Caenorhabditis brenneri]|uniref:F-box domain-containing protein n=1 Tax=Caenorhabditis brenneri TaxID=135651 RepID=G0NGA7_CAEBE|nr:hypothetical protein CAEBREN_03414 [Caenorhabditis brenneri]